LAIEPTKEPEILSLLSQNNNNLDSAPNTASFVVAICGGTGSGKSTAVQYIRENLNSIPTTVLDQDSYYQDISHLPSDERDKRNFDHPDAIDKELFVSHLVKLKQGESISKPIYDYVTHTRKKGHTLVKPTPVILVEGILIFYYSGILELSDLKLFLDVDDDIRLIRRIKRDAQERGRSIESVISQYLQSVKPMHETYVQPMRGRADMVITGKDFDLGLRKATHLIQDALELNRQSESRTVSQCTV